MEVFCYRIMDSESDLEELGCNKQDLALLAPLVEHYTIRLRSIRRQEALKLKQEALSHDTVAVLTGDTTGKAALLLAGNESRLRELAGRLIEQPGSMAAAGEEILQAIQKARRPVNELHLGKQTLPLGRRTLIMGILNLTPDSFSDGGNYNDLEAALTRARQMAAEGADMIDVGGESTRPGSQQVKASEELARVMPVINALKKDRSFNTPLSIDTYKATVAREALQCGVEMVNDVWGLKKDPALGAVVAEFGVPVCLMHNRTGTVYEELIPDIITDLRQSITLAHQAGIDDDAIIIDPGIGFGKDLQQNLDVMRRLPEIRALGYPLLLGTSRKSMIGKTLDLPVEERLEGTAATISYGISAGADIVRVHDVREMRRVVQMTDAMIRRQPI